MRVTTNGSRIPGVWLILALVLAVLVALPGVALAEEPAVSHKQAMEQRGLEITYYYTDAFGTPIAATDDQGNIIWRAWNGPYGERPDYAWEPSEAFMEQFPLGYLGKPNDPETGLSYLNQRYYNAEIGRFYSMDPVGLDPALLPHSFNRYNYGHNNPYRFVDPLGGEALGWNPGSGLHSVYDHVEPGPVTQAVTAAAALGMEAAGIADGIRAGIAAFDGRWGDFAASLAGMGFLGKVRAAEKLVDAVAGAVVKGSGRGKNHLGPDPKASGPHSTARRDVHGNVTHHAEWAPNPRNPTDFDQVKRVDTQYANPHTHTNKRTGEVVPSPHVHDKSIPGGVRSAQPDELPR